MDGKLFTEWTDKRDIARDMRTSAQAEMSQAVGIGAGGRMVVRYQPLKTEAPKVRRPAWQPKGVAETLLFGFNRDVKTGRLL